jgi:hypothetical protein
MADKLPTKPAFSGLNLAEDLREFESAPALKMPPRPDTASLNAVSEQAGFPSREPRASKAAAPPPARELNFETRLTIRVTERDKQRFDDLAYRLRAPNGEAFRRLLDLFEASEASKALGRGALGRDPP